MPAVARARASEVDQGAGATTPLTPEQEAQLAQMRGSALYNAGVRRWGSAEAFEAQVSNVISSGGGPMDIVGTVIPGI